MQRERSLRRGRRAALACLALGCAAALAGCGAAAGAGGTGQPVIYDAHPSHILAQLFPSPGFIYPPVNGIPSWTLYGDGMLVYTSGPLGASQRTLLQARLAPDQVQQILDVVVRQYSFFASMQPVYGRRIPDTGSTLLTVSANNQSKTVTLYGDAGPQPDTQTQNIFAIERYLLGYHPANAQPYAPQGVAVLVYPARGDAGSAAVRPWPYPTVELARVEAAECPYLQPGTSCSPVSGPSGILPVYGVSGVDLLRQPGQQGTVSQGAATYFVVIWPLMPDVPPLNAHPTSGALPAPSIRVAMGGQIHQWPLISMNGVPTGA